MTRIFCDRCGKEIKQNPEGIRGPLHVIRKPHPGIAEETKTHDLCEKCLNEFEAWFTMIFE